MKPKITIGMAHHSDFDGVYFSVQALRAFHSEPDIELIVVDNSPANEHGQAVANLVKHWVRGRYIAMPENVGTTQPRERIFREATGEIVVCMDCHVLLVAGAVAALAEYFAAHPDSREIINGPMFFDDARNFTSHFNEQWRSEMWGTWGLAWSCACGQLQFSPVNIGGQAEYWTLSSPQRKIGKPTDNHACSCGKPLPTLVWEGHEAALVRAGFAPIAKLGPRPFCATGPAFEVPGCGLGCFAMRKAAWPGFNPHFRQFGGEELYIHEKVRRAGGRAICLPQFGWVHRFARVAGVKYPLSRYGKVRNYVLGYQELGWDLRPVHEHFVASGLMPREHWDWLLEDPVRNIAWRYKEGSPASKMAARSCGQPAEQQSAAAPKAAKPAFAESASLEEVYQYLRDTPRDLDQHLDKLRDLAAGQHVVEISKRRESTFAFLHGQCKSLTAFQREQDPLLLRAPKLAGKTKLTFQPPDQFGLPEIPACDVLYIDDVHTADRLWSQLAKYHAQVRRRIILRGTGAFGEKAEGIEAPGLLVALRRFMSDKPAWSVVYHTKDQYGMTVISRDKADKPALPGVVTLAANFAKAVTEHVADGAQKVDAAELERRLKICTLCDQRRDERCSACGCYIHVKASWRSSQCPLGHWRPESPPAAAG